MRLVQGDVTDLRSAGVGSGFRLLLDTGAFHDLNSTQREAMGREVDAVAAADATMLLLPWQPRRRGPLPRGVSRSDIEKAFPGWKLTDVQATGFEAPKPIELDRAAPAARTKGAFAENLIRAAQAACSYSLRMPPSRSCLRTLRKARVSDQ